MPRRRGPHAQQQHGEDDGQHQETSRDGESSTQLTPEQCAVEFLRRAMRNSSHWRPSMAMAKCLGVAQGKLLLTSNKEDTTNLVWVTVLVLIYCASQLPDLHELWYELADPATVWLYQQPHFVENREDLVQSACSLLNVRDGSSLLSSMFPEPKDEATLALEAELGDWKIGYLDQPPFTIYYWNEKTNLSTWRNPIETAKLEKERLEKKKQRDELLAKVLAMRVKINRDVVAPPVARYCEECSATTTATGQRQLKSQEALVLCLACGDKYFCGTCCDKVHAARNKAPHSQSSFRFRECVGIQGFPKQKEKVVLPIVVVPETTGTTIVT